MHLFQIFIFSRIIIKYYPSEVKFVIILVFDNDCFFQFLESKRIELTEKYEGKVVPKPDFW